MGKSIKNYFPFYDIHISIQWRNRAAWALGSLGIISTHYPLPVVYSCRHVYKTLWWMSLDSR